LSWRTRGKRFCAGPWVEKKRAGLPGESAVDEGRTRKGDYLGMTGEESWAIAKKKGRGKKSLCRASSPPRGTGRLKEDGNFAFTGEGEKVKFPSRPERKGGLYGSAGRKKVWGDPFLEGCHGPLTAVEKVQKAGSRGTDKRNFFTGVGGKRGFLCVSRGIDGEKRGVFTLRERSANRSKNT